MMLRKGSVQGRGRAGEEKEERLSRLNNTATIRWLHSRFSAQFNEKRSNSHYLYIPSELKKEKKIEKIFHDFDVDESGGLSIRELYEAFNKYGVEIEYEEVRQLYAYAGVKEFTIDSFKKFSLDQRSNAIFEQIVKNIDARRPHDYLPHSFIRMFVFLVYKIKTEESRKRRLAAKSVVQQFDELLYQMRIPDLKMNNELVFLERQRVHDRLRKKLEDIYESKLVHFKDTVEAEKYNRAKRMKRQVIDFICPQLLD